MFSHGTRKLSKLNSFWIWWKRSTENTPKLILFRVIFKSIKSHPTFHLLFHNLAHLSAEFALVRQSMSFLLFLILPDHSGFEQTNLWSETFAKIHLLSTEREIKVSKALWEENREGGKRKPRLIKWKMFNLFSSFGVEMICIELISLTCHNFN